MLLRVIAVVSGAPLATALLASGCGRVPVEEPRLDDDATVAGADSSLPLFESGVSTDAFVARSDASRPPAPPGCPERLMHDVGPSCAADAGMVVAVCLPLPESGTCDSYTDACILYRYTCGLIQGGRTVECPMSVGDACCWQVSGDCAVGRPFVVDGRAIVASLANEDTGWLDASLLARLALAPVALDLDERTRATIADVWARDALAEHASVASFSRFVSELLAVGAPAELVTAARKATAEEIEHARIGFSLATHYAGAPLGPGVLVIDDTSSGRVDLADLAARTAAEGCVAETIASLQLSAAADAARDATLGALLRAMAEEEAEHALLAWRMVRWAIDAGGAPVVEAVGAVFVHASSHVGFGPCATRETDVLRAHGILTRRERHCSAVAALRDVIAPAARSLLEARGADHQRTSRTPA
jgi:hypothetical protein